MEKTPPRDHQTPEAVILRTTTQLEVRARLQATVTGDGLPNRLAFAECELQNARFRIAGYQIPAATARATWAIKHGRKFRRTGGVLFPRDFSAAVAKGRAAR